MNEKSEREVSLREITADTLGSILKLKVHPNQKQFVADNATSPAQANFHPEAWYRAIYYGDTPAGFVMVEDSTLKDEKPQHPEPTEPELFLWRFMIDQEFQGRGIGRAALDLVIEHVKAKNITDTFGTSYVPGDGCPREFYIKAGFEPTGEVDEGEIVLSLDLRKRRT